MDISNENIWLDPYDNNKYIIEENNIIKAVGGDGTLIKSIHLFKNKNKPFFGVSAGTVNFLMNEEDSVCTEHIIEKFNLIDIEVFFTNKVNENKVISKKFEAFNDIVLGEFNAWIDFECIHNDLAIENFKGSGVIVSTSQGSTGINKNNLGTILPLSSKNWSLTGIQTNRVVNHIIEPTELEISCSSRGDITLCIDGSYKIVKNVTKVVLNQGREVQVIFNNYKKFKEKRQ